jgi:hypothetical protein
MLPHRERTHRAHIVGIVRDTVEVVAIIAAGLWAFYVFIYENRILPTFAQPEVNFSASLQKISRHNGLIGVRIETDLHNVGTVRAHFLGQATAVLGERVQPLASPRPPNRTFETLQAEPFFRASEERIVYENANLTSLGDARVKQDNALEPGADQRFEAIFYVPQDRFDRLKVFMLGRFTRYDDKVIPTQLVVSKDGLPSLRGSHTDVYQFSTFVTELDLNGP